MTAEIARSLVLSCACLASILLSFGGRAADLPPLDMVIDQAEVLSADANANLRSKLASFEREHQAAVVVVLVPTTAPESIEDRARHLANTWQIGRSYHGRGMLLLLALQDRRYRLEVSNALASQLADEDAKEILATHLRPGLRAGTPDRAVAQLLDALGEHLSARRTAVLEPPAEACSSAAQGEVAVVAPESEKTRSFAIWIIGLTLLVGLILLGLAIWVSVAVARWVIARTTHRPQPLMVCGGSAVILSITALATGWMFLFSVVLTMALVALVWFGVPALINSVRNASATSNDESSFGSSIRADSADSRSSSSDESSSEGSANYEGRGASDSY